MKRRSLREHRQELRCIWGLLASWELDVEAEDVISQELGITSHDLYFAPTLDVPSDVDSDPEEDLRSAISDERVFVEAVSDIRELQHLQSELKRARLRIRSLRVRCVIWRVIILVV